MPLADYLFWDTAALCVLYNYDGNVACRKIPSGFATNGIWDSSKQEKLVLGHLCLHGYEYHSLSKNGIWPKLPVSGTDIASI